MAREPVPPLDQTTWHNAQFVVTSALRAGQDPVEMLNRHGMLVTPARSRQMSLVAVRALLASMYGWSTVEMLRRRNRDIGSATVADMYMATLSYVAEFVTVVEEKGLDL